MKANAVLPGLHRPHRVRRKSLTALELLQRRPPGLLHLRQGAVGQKHRMEPYPLRFRAEQPVDVHIQPDASRHQNANER